MLCGFHFVNDVDTFRCASIIILFIYIFIIITATTTECHADKIQSNVSKINSLAWNERKMLLTCCSNNSKILEKRATTAMTIQAEVEWRHVKQNRENGKWLCVCGVCYMRKGSIFGRKIQQQRGRKKERMRMWQQKIVHNDYKLSVL